MDLCRELGTEPYICVNMGSGTRPRPRPGSSTATAPATPRGRMRAGSMAIRSPTGSSCWGIGNEMYGDWQIGNMNAHDYVKKARAFAHGDEADRSVHRAHRLRPERLERVGRDRAERAGRVSWTTTPSTSTPAVPTTTRPCSSRIRPSGPCGSAPRSSSVSATPSGIAHPISHRLRRVERVVADAQPRGPRGRRGGALQPVRRAGHRPPT